MNRRQSPTAGMSAQLSLFPSTDPVVGLRAWCQCDANAAGRLPTWAKAAARIGLSLTCNWCGRHRGWASHESCRFIETLIANFGRPTEPIRISSPSTDTAGSADAVHSIQQLKAEKEV